MGKSTETSAEQYPISKPIVRPATPQDAEEITKLLTTVYTKEAEDHQNLAFTASHQKVADTLHDIDTNFVFVVEANNRLVGTITLYHPKKPENKHGDDPRALQDTDVAEFGHFAVLPEFRKGDLGQALLEKVEQQAREIGVNKLALVTRYEEPSTHLEAYYRGLGFEDIEGGIFTMPHLGFPTIALVKPLAANS